MTLSADELEILEYLKSWKGNYVTMVEICRCAGGRRRFREAPNWAKGLMARLVEGRMVEVNERGHYRVPPDPQANAEILKPAPPAPKAAAIVGEDYFPSSIAEDDVEAETQRWISPQIAEILKKSGKKFED